MQPDVKKNYRHIKLFFKTMRGLFDFGHFFCPFLILGFTIWKKSRNVDVFYFSKKYTIKNKTQPIIHHEIIDITHYKRKIVTNAALFKKLNKKMN